MPARNKYFIGNGPIQRAIVNFYGGLTNRASHTRLTLSKGNVTWAGFFLPVRSLYWPFNQISLLWAQSTSGSIFGDNFEHRVGPVSTNSAAISISGPFLCNADPEKFSVSDFGASIAYADRLFNRYICLIDHWVRLDADWISATCLIRFKSPFWWFAHAVCWIEMSCHSRNRQEKTEVFFAVFNENLLLTQVFLSVV